MSWLKQYGAVLDCTKRSITLTHPTRGVVTYWTDASLAPSACYPLSPELQLFFSQGDHPPEIHELPVVSDFPNVFPKELPGMPPDRSVEFVIELVPGSAPISKRPYRMVPEELAELKRQIEELEEKKVSSNQVHLLGVVRPSLSRSGIQMFRVWSLITGR